MKTKVGLEVLLEKSLDLLKGKRVGLLVHQPSVTSSLEHSVILLHKNPEVQLTTVFGPQHGIWGETQDNMIEWSSYKDQKTGLPFHSLYGETRKPTPEMLRNVDTVVIDLQDVGSRYYTYIYTMALTMEACAETGKEVIVLDRPNPINGSDIEGPVLDPAFKSFVGLYPLPVRHGMTCGELALYFNRECGISCELTVVSMENWKREMYFDDTGFPWVIPSPNMPTLPTALVYPGMCLFEATNVSEARGTTMPFELTGAPWIGDPHLFADKMAGFNLPGVTFRPLFFTPTFHKWKDELIGGVQTHVTDRKVFKPFLTGLALVAAYRETGGDRFQWKEPPYEYEYDLLPFDILAGSDQSRLQVENSVSLSEIENSWTSALEEFREIRQRYLLY
jgi:uncharacterized protein YbbC (DUF1343 family)